MTMTRTEALAIVASKAPCPHESWAGGGTTDWAKCTDCGETFRKGGLHKRKDAAARFQEALDLLAAEPAPAPMLYPCITIPKRLPDEKMADPSIRTISGGDAMSTPRPHNYETHADHDEDSQMCRFICDGGLAYCKTCHGAEGSLPTECPGDHIYIDGPA